MQANRSLKRKYQVVGFAFLLPAVGVYLLFMTYPLLDTMLLSFSDWRGFGERAYTAGLSNYARALSDQTFIRALKNTVYFAFFSSIFSVLIGVLMAWFNMFLRRMEGQVFRTILFAPNMISPTITGLLFLFIFTEDIGLVNNVLSLLGLGNLRTAWLTNMNTVKPIIVLVTVWRQFGLPMVLCYAGLQNIPQSLIESARLDGASEGQILRRVLLPLIKPMIQLATMFTMLGGLKIYDSVVSLTGGGPARMTVVLPMWIVENAFTYSKFGYAATMSVLFVGVVFVFMVVLRLFFRGEAYEY